VKSQISIPPTSLRNDGHRRFQIKSRTVQIAGIILSMQSNQFCAVHDLICAVQDEKLCSPKITKLQTSVWNYTE